MAVTPQYHEPTFTEKASSTISTHAPSVISKIILLAMRAFVISFRFIRDLFLEAINRK